MTCNYLISTGPRIGKHCDKPAILFEGRKIRCQDCIGRNWPVQRWYCQRILTKGRRRGQACNNVTIFSDSICGACRRHWPQILNNNNIVPVPAPDFVPREQREVEAHVNIVEQHVAEELVEIQKDAQQDDDEQQIEIQKHAQHDDEQQVEIQKDDEENEAPCECGVFSDPLCGGCKFQLKIQVEKASNDFDQFSFTNPNRVRTQTFDDDDFSEVDHDDPKDPDYVPESSESETLEQDAPDTCMMEDDMYMEHKSSQNRFIDELVTRVRLLPLVDTAKIAEYFKTYPSMALNVFDFLNVVLAR